MRYRIKSGRAAARREFFRPEQNEHPGKHPAPPPRAADCDNPYFRCFGKARSLDELKGNREK